MICIPTLERGNEVSVLVPMVSVNAIKLSVYGGCRWGTKRIFRD